MREQSRFRVRDQVIGINGAYSGEPLHDRNGDVIAALRVEMKSFFGQMERNALARAMPIAKDMEKWFAEAKELRPFDAMPGKFSVA